MKPMSLTTNKVFKIKRFTPELCRTNPEMIFIFGDNTERVGTAGQACIRTFTNTIGVATKWAPDYKDTSYFTDSLDCYHVIRKDWLKVLEAHDEGHTLCLPEDGLGTGLSMLPEKAPQLAKWLEHWCIALYLDEAPYMPSYLEF